MAKVPAEKLATVDEVHARAESTSTAVVTEYRGMTVAEISTLRRQLRALGTDYKVFKNTLVRRAIAGTSVEALEAFLGGPTAIAFVDGDVSAVARALRDFAKETPTLVIKGGVLDGQVLSSSDLAALADLPSREVLLARLAGLFAAPMATMAALLLALPQNLAYGLSALVESRGGVPGDVTATSEPAVTPADPGEVEPPSAEPVVVEAMVEPEAADEPTTDTNEAEALSAEQAANAPE